MNNKTILVTGATRGIGRELVSQLRELGFRVFATGRDEALLASLKQQTGCSGAPADLADPAQAVALYAKAREALGSVDVLINNAGFNHRKSPIVETDVEDWDRQYAVNLRAPFILSREALRDMSPRRSGHIINIISTTAKTSSPNYSVYSTMKYGLMGFTQCLIKEARLVDVKVTAVYPGGVDSDFRVEERPDYMTAASVAKMIIHCVNAPADVNIHDLTFRPMVEDNF